MVDGGPDRGPDAAPGSIEPAPGPQYPVASVERTLTAIELLAEHPELKLSEVRNHLGVGQASAHRLMATLVSRGFAEQDAATLVYRAGPRLLEAGRAAVVSAGWSHHARPVLEWLAGQSGETAQFGVLSATEVRYVEVVESKAALRVAGRVGRLAPAHATSMGKAMLATFEDGAVSRTYAGGSLSGVGQLAAPTQRAVSNLPALLAELARTRARGWARDRGEMESGVCSVGLAVASPLDDLVGGLSISTPQARSTPSVEKRHAELLGAARARLLSSLG